jgi:hypothetical protein
MKLYALILGLEDGERDELLKLIAAPDLAHLRAAPMEIASQRPWWDQPTPYPAKAARSPLTLYKTPGGEVLRTLNVTWQMTVLEKQIVNGAGWLKVNATPEMWARAEDCASV